MNKKILDNIDYTFDASAKTILFADDLDIKHLLVITNITDNQFIYNFACEGYGGTLSGRTVTLEYDTTSMSDDDTLQIIMYTEKTDSEDSIIKSLVNQEMHLECLNTLIEEQQNTNKILKKIYS